MTAEQTIATMTTNARKAAATLAAMPAPQRANALRQAAEILDSQHGKVLAANQNDVEEASAAGQTEAFIDRLTLTPERLLAISSSLQTIAAQDDPLGITLEEWERPNGLYLRKVRVPIGVIGIIFEARPNVVADAGALCLKSGNACILRTGSGSLHSARAIHACLLQGLQAANVPADAIQLIPVADRAMVGAMLSAAGGIDVIIPRGGRSLTERVANESKVPVLKHLDGICHTYIDAAADPGKAVDVTFNAKMRRPGICGATETILVHRAALPAICPLLTKLRTAGCEVRGDAAIQAMYPDVVPATDSDWGTEYLAAIVSMKVVDSAEEAIDHINAYGSHHTDAIITEDADTAHRFMHQVDSAIVMHNTSTQFADGGEFGFGAEIGISTDRLHARGPVGAKHLTTFKYMVSSAGGVRP